VRVDTVRAIAQIGGDEAALLLRLKAYAGDEEPQVLGECFAAILDREPDAAVAFIAPFLVDDDDEVKAGAASALALARDPAALEHLTRFLETTRSPELRTAAVVACAASPQIGIVDLLFTIVGGDDRRLAATAIRALGESRFRNQVRERARALPPGAAASSPPTRKRSAATENPSSTTSKYEEDAHVRVFPSWWSCRGAAPRVRKVGLIVSPGSVPILS
jgi:HEAT repeat protein